MKIAKQAKQKSVVIPVRVPADMQLQIRSIAEQSTLSDADVFRMAVVRGLPALEKMFSLPKKAA